MVSEGSYPPQQAASSTQSVAEAIREAMNTAQGPSVRSPRDLPAPEAHLPLRKASGRKLQTRRGAPRPLFTASQQNRVRGFDPLPVTPLPYINNITATSEHAFAGRDVRRPSKLPLGGQAGKHGRDQQITEAEWPLDSSSDVRPPSSPLLPPLRLSPRRLMSLRSTKSLGDNLRSLQHRSSGGQQSVAEGGTPTPDSDYYRPSMATDGVRSSFRSALTSNSSLLNTSSIHTDQSSPATRNSSHSDFVKVYPDWPETDEYDFSQDMSVDDAIGMYADGFESAKQSLDARSKQSMQSERAERPTSQPTLVSEKPQRPNPLHRRSQSASLLMQFKPPAEVTLEPPQAQHQRTSTQIVANRDLRFSQDDRPPSKAPPTTAVPRDRYGFKKVSHYISIEQYDAWDMRYKEHLDRRQKKWHILMRSYGLSTDQPIRFPPKSDKIKRYVRKGIPPNLRGAAWFWYAGGPGKLAKEPGLYMDMLEQVENGGLNDNDREHIERDLNRTFPDNIRFKPDPTTTLDAQADAGGGKKRKSADPETAMVRALRRVLQAFAVHNPNIGYCQSLNFIAGLLLLFVDEDEEKAFTLLNIVTSLHLPGTHGVALEGANIDIAVLMSCIKDTLPGIWSKLDDKGGGGPAGDPSAQALRLPTVSLATTAWFMSLFVGTLPIEAVLRVWDCLFFEGSKTLFRIALAIFKAGERAILAVHDPMEIFQVVQTIPRAMLDVNALLDVCFRRRGGFGHISQDLVERRREERRTEVRQGVGTLESTGRAATWKGRWRSKTKV